ncbi:ead/Ea22-like family protein [Escherichia coli]|nr:ead/Ea22-like family protein [Escherichia coli]
MSEINYQALRDVAEKATWGDWDSYKPHRGARGYEVRLSSQAIAQHVLKNNAEFIAAFNPKIALALLDERERNQQYIKSRDQENEEIALTVGKLRVELEAAENRNAKLQSENAYIRNRYKELDLLIGKNILVMQAAIIEWQSTGDVGISSATLASIACGLKKNIYGHHFGAPHDAADFRRCVALVEQIPEIRDSFDKVAKRVPAFKGILNEWDSLVALLKSEMKIHGNKAPETYRRISELRKD